MKIFTGKSRERIKALDGKYSVSDLGVVYSDGLPLAVIGGVGVNLHGERKKVAYLVARAFVPNAESRKYVRHKNGDVRDNRASNLEWSDEKEERRRGRKVSERWCKAWTLDGDVVGIWKDVREAALATGILERTIRAALSGRQRTGGGLLWRDLV